MNQDWESLYVFTLALVLTLLFSIREVIEQELHRNKGKWELRVWLATKALTAGLIGLTVFNALQQLQIVINLWGFNFTLNDSVAIFFTVSSMVFLDDLITKARQKIKEK